MKRSRFENVGAGVFTNFAGSSNFYIADNTFIGRNDPKHLIGWNGEHVDEVQRRRGADLPAEDGVVRRREALWPRPRRRLQLHRRLPRRHQRRDLRQSRRLSCVRAGHRRRAEVSDRASTGTAGPVAIDFYNNYITNSHDNPIEADGSMHNIRIMRNMLINHASHAFCNQPTLGGPGLLDPQHRLQPAGAARRG